jgi:large subunit ribosomal protein L21
MYAIVNIAGHQFKVTKDSVISTQKVEGEAGDKVEFDRVMLLSTDKNIKVGTPYIEGASIQATVVDQIKDKKVVIFKKKRRKGYKLKRGHRQPKTRLKIDKIVS